jgi:hypothetical protein
MIDIFLRETEFVDIIVGDGELGRRSERGIQSDRARA